jgi:hypothetical protein
MLQKIIIYTALDERDTCLISTGIQLALHFGKELCLFHQVSEGYNMGKTDEKLKKYQQVLHHDFPNLQVTLLVASFSKGKLAAHLADEHEAIILIAGSSAFKKLAIPLQNSPIPFLFVNEQMNSVPDFGKIVYPVDLRSQNRDVLKWILYFGKFHKSEIIAIGANDKLQPNRKLVEGHLSALKAMLTRYKVTHKIYRGAMNSLRVHHEGFEAAEQLHAGMLVLLGSSFITLIDILIGLPEEKIVKKADHFAVLVINPKRETYLVCE